MRIQTILVAVVIVFGMLLQTSCEDEWDAIEEEIDCRNARRSRVEREFVLPNFTGIELEISANVFISKGATQRVMIEGQSDAINDIRLQVNDGIWEIEFDRCYKSYEDINVYVTMTDLSEVSLASSGYIVSQSDFTVDNLKAEITGSGNILLNNVTATHTTSLITGSGNIHLTGSTNVHDVYITGSGSVVTFGLNSEKADVTIIGSGDAEISVSNDLDVGITGSGSVFYKGNPTTINSSISGSGQVVKVD